MPKWDAISSLSPVHIGFRYVHLPSDLSHPVRIDRNLGIEPGCESIDIAREQRTYLVAFFRREGPDDGAADVGVTVFEAIEQSRYGGGVLDRAEGVGHDAADVGVTVFEAIEQGRYGSGVLDRAEGVGRGAADAGVTVFEAIEQGR